MKKVAVVTVDFNSHTETHNFLASLRKVKHTDLDVVTIVVDNFSKEPFVPTADERKESSIFLRTNKNLGFTGGFDFGIERALSENSDYVLLINNDTLLDVNVLQELVRTLEENQKAGIIVPKIYFAKNHEFHKERYKESEKGRVFWYAGGFMDWANVFSRHIGVDEVDNGQYDEKKSIDFATGCCMLMPANVLEKVGIFDNTLFLYFEDADLSQRVLKAGYEIIYQPKAVIWHVNAASGGGAGSPLHDYYITRNRMIFGMRYASLRTKAALIRESIRILLSGRTWQKRGVQDFYLRRFGKGSFGI